MTVGPARPAVDPAGCQVCLDKIDLYRPTIDRLEALPPTPQQRRVLRRTREAVAYWTSRSVQPHHHAPEDF